jgi:hypothetical protein
MPIPKFYVVTVFEETREKRWVEENKPSPYTEEEKLPAAPFLLGPGVTDHPSVVAGS